MNAVGDVADRKDRPAYVRFERVAEEDKPASVAAGHFVAKDVDYVNITPPYSKDVFKQRVRDWLVELDRQVQNRRMPEQWAKQYKDSYRAWQTGQELPVNGTPIKGWGVISPAQQETMIRMNILTVEDLAAINDEGIRRIGMGAVELKNKAKAWLAQLQDKGPLTIKMAQIEGENAQLKGQVDTLTRQVEELMAAVRTTQKVADTPAPAAQSESITADDLIDDEPAARPRRRAGQSAGL